MQNHPKPDLKLILRPKEDFRDIFQPGLPGWLGPCINQPLSKLKFSLFFVHRNELRENILMVNISPKVFYYP
jgi:hypothetical protein